jgi:hypothetical protein
LLANARFILPPQLDRLALRGGRDGGGNQIGKVFYAPAVLRHRLEDGAAAPRCG